LKQKKTRGGKKLNGKCELKESQHPWSTVKGKQNHWLKKLSYKGSEEQIVNTNKEMIRKDQNIKTHGGY